MLNPEKISHEHLTDLSTSPVRCGNFFGPLCKYVPLLVCYHFDKHELILIIFDNILITFDGTADSE